MENDAHKELQTLQQHMLQLQQKKSEIQKQIDDDFLNEQIGIATTNIEKQEELEAKFKALVEPVINQLTATITKKVKKEKAKKGYARVTDMLKKMEMQNQILGPIANELELEMDSGLILNAKRKFDNI